jgi:cytochrome P450
MKFIILATVILFSQTLYSKIEVAEDCIKTYTNVPGPKNIKAIKTFFKMSSGKGIVWELFDELDKSYGPLNFIALPSWMKSILLPFSYFKGKIGKIAKGLRGFPGMVMVNEPSAIQEIFRNPQHFTRPYDPLRSIFPNSFFVMQDQDPDELAKWRFAHDILMPYFNPKRISQEFTPIIQDHAQQFAQAWLKKIEQDSLIRNIGAWSYHYTVSLASRLFFGVDLPWRETQELKRTLNNILAMNDIDKTREALHTFMKSVIEKRKSMNVSRDTMLDGLLRAQKKDTLEIEFVIDQMTTIFFAAQETTKFFIAHTLYRFAKEPAWQTIIRKEITQLERGEISLEQMEVLDSFLKESLRYRPPVPMVPRAANKDIVLNGMNIKKGTYLYVSPMVTHMSERLWGPEAKEFHPERFLDLKLEKGQFCPFAGGSRVCIGQFVAVAEVKILMIELLKVLKPYLNTQERFVSLGGNGVFKTPSNFHLKFEKLD